MRATWWISIAALVACGGGGDGEQEATTDTPVVAIDAAPAEPERVERRQERAVFRLGDNRLLAHAHRGGALYIDAGSGGFAKYARFDMPEPRWNMRRELDGHRVAQSHRNSSFDVPLTAQQAATATAMHIRVHAGSKRTGEVKINGKKVEGGLKLAEGWQTVSVPVPEGKLAVGENRVNFELNKGKRVSVSWIQFGGEPSDDAPVSYDADADAFTISSGSGLVYYVLVPKAGFLVASVSDGCKVDVRAAGHANKLDSALEGDDAEVDLSSLVGEVIRLELTAAGCDAAELTAARITVPGVEAETHTAPPPEHVVFWIMDALRADRVKLFNPEARADVPNFERLAAKSAVFTSFWVEGNESQTSHSSLWSSLYPIVHNVRTTGKKGGTWKLKSRFARIPQQMKKAGFYNIGVTANGYVNPHSGYGKDFDEFTNAMGDRMYYDRGTVPSDKLQQFAAKQVDAHVKSKKTFLYLGTIDTHAPWMARKPWIDQYDPEPYRGPHDVWIDLLKLGWQPGTMHCSEKPVNKRDFERLMAIYDSDVSFQDKTLGMLLDDLEKWGIADKTMIVITADHGEEMFEHKRCGHGASLYETLVHVPLVIYYPPLFPGGTVVTEGVDGVDVLPTMVEAVGLPAIEAAQGASLVALAQGVGGGYVRPTYASQYEYAHAMRLGDWKLHVGKSGVDLHNMASDPFEYEDLSYKRPVEHRFLTDVFSMFMVNRAEWKKRVWGVASNMTARGASDLDSVVQ
jgi:arylsulfatase A-like enzyme